MTEQDERLVRVDESLAKQLQRSIEANAQLTIEYRALLRKAAVMRNAIDYIEGALMGFDTLMDLPKQWGEPRLGPHVATKLTVLCADVYRVHDALAECTRIINSDEFTLKEGGE